LRKKIVVKKRIGPNCEKNEGLSELGDFMFLVRIPKNLYGAQQGLHNDLSNMLRSTK